MKILDIVLVATVVLGVLFIAPAEAVDKPAPAIIVFDSSGSMAAVLSDGRTKLDTARSVISHTLKSWPANGDLGLIAYGHRRKSDCTDIETILPLGPLDAAAVTRALKPLMARGKTPLSRSLVAASKLLPQGPATIVLVSDGIETCDADPCATAAALKAANRTLIIHVVGFGVQKDETEQLSCIAHAGDGQFFDARNAEALTTALEAVKQDTVAPPDPEPPPPASSEPPPVPSSKPPAPSSAEPIPPPTEPSSAEKVPDPPVAVKTTLAATAGELGELVSAPVTWTVHMANGETAYQGESRKLELQLLPGSYSVEAATANVVGSARIEVLPNADQSFDIPIKTGRLDLSLAANADATPYGEADVAGIVWAVQPVDGQPAANAPPIAAPSLLLAPGRYRVTADLNHLHAQQEVEVAAGAAQPVKLTFRLGTVTLEAALDQTAEPLADASLLTWTVKASDGDLLIEGRARPDVTVPEGTYPVVLSILGANVSAEAKVKAGDHKTVRVLVPTGTISLSAKLGPASQPIEDWRDTFWTVTPLRALGASEPIELQESNPSLSLPPGRWHVVLLSGTITTEQDVAVAPGVAAPLSVVLGAGRVTMTATSADGGAEDTEYTATKLSADGSPGAEPAYDAGSSESVSTILIAGRWRIAADAPDGKHAETEIDLKAGDETTVALPLK